MRKFYKEQLFMLPENSLQRCMSVPTIKLHKREIISHPHFHMIDLHDGLNVLVMLK